MAAYSSRTNSLTGMPHRVPGFFLYSLLCSQPKTEKFSGPKTPKNRHNGRVTTMDEQFRQYRYARIEGQRITQAELETQFKDGITDLDALDKTIEQLLARQAAPWRTTDLEQEGFREGIRMAALEFYWQNRQQIRRLIHDPSQRPT